MSKKKISTRCRTGKSIFLFQHLRIQCSLPELPKINFCKCKSARTFLRHEYQNWTTLRTITFWYMRDLRIDKKDIILKFILSFIYSSCRQSCKFRYGKHVSCLEPNKVNENSKEHNKYVPKICKFAFLWLLHYNLYLKKIYMRLLIYLHFGVYT